MAELEDDETEIYDEEDERVNLRNNETEAYSDLVNDGCPPLYPISLLEQVSRNPEEHREMLWPFWAYPRDYTASWLVLQRQLKRWQDFRNWQNDNRSLKDDDDGYTAYVEMRKRGCIKDGELKELAEIEADPECLRSGWERHEHYIRRWQRRWQREPDCDGFPHYSDAMKRRLARHGFTWPFQLHEDPKQQDRLTTWIEYLSFEYWWLDRHTKSIERLKPDHDRRWQELVNSELFKPYETKEFIRTTISSMQRGEAIDRAWEAREEAESEAREVFVSTQEDSHCLSVPATKRIRMLQATTRKLVAAKQQYEFAKRRDDLARDFIQATFDHEYARKDAARQQILLQWVLKQLISIKPDLQLRKSESKVASLGRRHKKQTSNQRELGSHTSNAAAAICASLENSDDRSKSQTETQGLLAGESTAKHSLQSMHASRLFNTDAKEEIQRLERHEEETTTTGHHCVANHQRQTEKRRRSDISPPDEISMMPSRDDTEARLSMRIGIQYHPIANSDEIHLGNRSSKRQKLKHQTLSSVLRSRPVNAGAGENLTEANSAIDQTESRGWGTNQTVRGPRRSARIAACRVMSGIGVALRT